VKVARKERRAKVQDFRSLGSSEKSFSKKLKKGVDKRKKL